MDITAAFLHAVLRAGFCEQTYGSLLIAILFMAWLQNEHVGCQALLVLCESKTTGVRPESFRREFRADGIPGERMKWRSDLVGDVQGAWAGHDVT